MKPLTEYTLNEWLTFLECRHKQEIQMGLTRTRRVAQRMGLLKHDACMILVAGTNGKGSTVASLEAIYRAARYQVGCYTSPHVVRFNERIGVNQQPISDSDLCLAFCEIEAARGDTSLTFFEVTTLAALWYFKRFSLDIIVLEVGMGGRFDATNIIEPDLAIITTVDYDHQEILGNTLEDIGYQKAGILRPHIPFVYADYQPPATVVNEANALQTEMHCLGLDYFFNTVHDTLRIARKGEEAIVLPVPKIHPKAAVAAFIASECLQTKLPVTQQAYCQAMQKVKISGRQEVVEHKGVRTVFDVAHNVQSVQLLADKLSQYTGKGTVHAVFSCLADKDLLGLIRPMKACVSSWYVSLLEGNRALNESILRTAFKQELNIEPICYNTPLVAYQAAYEAAKSGDTIVVYGSFRIVGPIMAQQRS